jgi:hypothetical protein
LNLEKSPQLGEANTILQTPDSSYLFLMKKNLSLSIPRPCSQKWSSFQKTAEGGFCGSCQKVVVDFTSMSDEQIVSYFKSRPSHTCGKFRPAQLTQYPLYSNTTHFLRAPSLLKVAALSLGFLFGSRETTANIHHQRVEVSETAGAQHHYSPLLKTVTGRVIMKDDDSPMPGVNVVVRGTTRGTVTDSDGYFTLTDLNEGDVLVLSFIGFVTKEYKITDRIPETFTMEFEMLSDITGEVNVQGVYSSKPGLWTRIKNLF